MSHNCCVPFCNATSKKSKNLRFHRFPKKRKLNDQWIAKIRRDEGDYFAVTENTRVCSKHFCEEDYKVSEDGKGKKIVLKKGAVPTIFKWSSEKRSRSTFVSKGKRKGEDFEVPTKEPPALWKKTSCYQQELRWFRQRHVRQRLWSLCQRDESLRQHPTGHFANAKYLVIT